MTMTKRDAINGSMSIAEDIAEGRLDPAALQDRAVAELRELVGTVAGPDDPCWPVQLDITRGVLALGGIPADELAEWLAVARHRAGEPEPLPDPAPLVPLDPVADAEPEPDADPEPTEPEPVIETVATVKHKRRADGGYDPLASWLPGRSLLVD
jgi:hypothetical protein